MRISVIIPALDEEALVGRAIKSALGKAFEVIVVDGGSVDKTAQVAASAGAAIIKTGAGRGRQMDAGAAAAKGDVLLFLHADAVLPSGWKGTVEAALASEAVVAGAFRLSIDADGAVLRLIELGANLRSKYLSIVYGDQAIFARKGAFMAAGGFKNIPLMEDADCVRRLRQTGGMVLLGQSVMVSPRRWSSGGRLTIAGALKRTLLNWLILGLYLAGCRPERLYRFYYGKAGNVKNFVSNPDPSEPRARQKAQR